MAGEVVGPEQQPHWKSTTGDKRLPTARRLRPTKTRQQLAANTVRMLGKTHFAIGIAAATAVVQPQTAFECLSAVLAGAVGGVLCDVDTLRNDGKRDSVAIQCLSAAVSVCILAADRFLNTGLCAAALSQNRQRLILGAAVYVALWIIGYFSNHRGFTHSLAAGAMFSQAVHWLCPPLAVPFAAAYASHITMDLLNKKGLRLLWPMKGGVRLGWCYADRTADTLLFQLGILASIFFMMNGTLMHLY